MDRLAQAPRDQKRGLGLDWARGSRVPSVNAMVYRIESSPPEPPPHAMVGIPAVPDEYERGRCRPRGSRSGPQLLACHPVPASDHRAITRLFDAHGAMVYRRALRLMGNAADAEEAVQEVFLRAMPDERMPDSSVAVAWLYRVTTNYCLNQLRNKKRRRVLLDEQVAPNSPQHQAAEDERIVAMRGLLSRADEREARCAVYVFVDGLSYDETADVMEVSRGTVANLIRRFKDWAQGELSQRDAEAS